MNNWIYKNKIVNKLEDIPKDVIGFVYELTYVSNKKYIGKRNLYSTQSRPMLLSGLKRCKESCKGYISSIIKPRKRVEIITRENNWIDYQGSSILIPKEEHIVFKEILYYCRDKNCLSYMEEKCLFETNAIIIDKYYNKTIQHRHFDNALIGLIYDVSQDN